MNFRMLARLALCVIVLFGMPAVVFGAPGPFERNWDWVDNKRDLTFCIEPNTPPLIADAAGFAASNLSNADFEWTLTDMGNCPANWDLRKPAKGQAHIRVRVADLGAVVRPAGPHPESLPDYDQGEEYRPTLTNSQRPVGTRFSGSRPWRTSSPALTCSRRYVKSGRER